MKHALNIWVVGGDLRQWRLAGLLADDGHTVHTFALDQAGALPGVQRESALTGAALADCVVLPLPAEGEAGLLNTPLSGQRCPTERLLDALRPGQLVCAGRVSAELARAAQTRELRLQDYFAREELAVANAVPTAEGTLQIAMEELPITIHEARVLIIGYGRLGKVLAQRFAALGARVSVAARRCADLAWISAFGYGMEHTDQLAGWLCGYDLVINTAPARLLNEPELRDLRPGCLVIDLASKPGGVDLEAAARLGVRVVWALSLPGKAAPVTAGHSIKTTIYNILHELGV